MMGARSRATVANRLSPQSEAAAKRIVAKWYSHTAIPVGHIELILTENCNHRCDYCFVKDKNNSHVMSEMVGRQAVDFVLAQARRSPQCNVLFFGGEPLLEFGLLRELVGYAQHRATSMDAGNKLSFSITTNGTLLTEEMARFLREQRIMYLLSVDGDRAVHDAHRRLHNGGSSYDLLMARFQMLKHHQPWQGARMTVHPEFARRVHENVEHLARAGINQFIIGPASGVMWNSAALRLYGRSLVRALSWVHEQARRGAPLKIGLLEQDLGSAKGAQRGEWGCGAGRGRMCVAAAGKLYPCSKMHGVGEAREPWCLGDVWNGITEYRKRALLLSRSDQLRPKCRACDIAGECVGGCPANGLEATGDAFAPTDLDCSMNRMLLGVREEFAEFVRRDREPPRVSATQHIRPIT